MPEKVDLRFEKDIERLRINEVNIVRFNKLTALETLKRYRGNVLLLIGFPYVVPEKVLKEFKMCLNVHPTLLPRYRGATELISLSTMKMNPVQPCILWKRV
jgi:methionyl-tRNA formyltransferase